MTAHPGVPPSPAADFYSGIPVDSISPALNSGSLDTLIRQEVYMEPLDTRVVFGLDRIVRSYGPYGEVSRNSNNTLTSMGRLKSYEAYSRYTPVSLEQLRRTPDNLSEPIRRYYLQLANHSDRIAELARSVTATQRTTIDRVYALQKSSSKELPLLNDGITR